MRGLETVKMSKIVTQERIDGFIMRCRGLGVKVTPQRVAIYRELLSTGEHPSAEIIYKKIKNYYSNISLTTIYRTLETFEKLGIISVANVLHDAARYDANLDHHHHLVCIVCKKVEDFYDDSIANLSPPKKSIYNYKVLSYTVQINGICKNCRKKRS
jgi:Fur family transcriptional regulator, peroxide stress response regulator